MLGLDIGTGNIAMDKTEWSAGQKAHILCLEALTYGHSSFPRLLHYRHLCHDPSVYHEHLSEVGFLQDRYC